MQGIYFKSANYEVFHSKRFVLAVSVTPEVVKDGNDEGYFSSSARTIALTGFNTFTLLEGKEVFHPWLSKSQRTGCRIWAVPNKSVHATAMEVLDTLLRETRSNVPCHS